MIKQFFKTSCKEVLLNMTVCILYCIIFIFAVFSPINAANDDILLEYKGNEDQAKKFADTLGLTFKGTVLASSSGKHGWYKFSQTEKTRSSSKDLFQRAKKMDQNVKEVTDDPVVHIYPRALTINDAQWAKQWHLQPAQTPSMNVYNVWNKGYAGNGVTIAFLDDGIDTDHSDLVRNYVSAYSYDFINGIADPSHKYTTEGHGTSCAGVAAAVKNTNCVIGTAFNASIASVRILDKIYKLTASGVARALTHQLSHVDIYSNSWGPSDNGTTFANLAAIEIAAFQRGVTEGRNGKGAIYTWASGNGGRNWDDCNADGYAKSIYTISVAAMSETTSYTAYSEFCSSILTATYSGDYPNRRITTTGPSNACVNDFSGTSSACPVASGIIALTLEANSSLSWRDVQHIIVETATSSGVNVTFLTNYAGKKYSSYFGFGLMNAEGMVNSALTWLGVPPAVFYKYPTISVNRVTHGITITDNYIVENCHISYLEHVEVEIHYAAYYRGDVRFYLVSPLKTESVIFSERPNDRSHLNDDVRTTFMSVHFWGERPEGQWTLHMIDMSSKQWTDMKLYTWKLIFHGTVSDPLKATPSPGTLGGTCDDTIDCSSFTNGGCFKDIDMCVTCDNIGHRVVLGYCVKDGYTNGYCDDFILCKSRTNICEFNVCVKDVDALGSQCNNAADCSSISNGGCLIDGMICVTCHNGYSVVNGYCIQDGTTNGYCDGSTPCVSSTDTCTKNVCVGTAGTLGSVCTSSSDCSTGLTGGCLVDENVCVTCSADYRIVFGQCQQDGSTNGYCDSSIPCVSNTDMCNNNSVCVEKDLPGENTDEGGATNIGLIAGAVIGGVAVVGSIGGFLIYTKLMKPKSQVAPSGQASAPQARDVQNQDPFHINPDTVQATVPRRLPPITSSPPITELVHANPVDFTV